MDSLSTENVFLLKHIENDDDSGICVKYDDNGRLLSILHPEKSFFLYYNEDNTIQVTSINSDGQIAKFSYNESPSSKTKTKGSTEVLEEEQQVITLQSAYKKLDDFLNENADKLAESDTPFIRMYAEELRDLPKDLVNLGAEKLITQLFGKRVWWFVSVYSYFDDLAWKQILFGNCNVSLQSVRKEGDNHFIYGAFENFNQIPGNGELDAEMIYGIVGKYGKSYSPDIYNNDFSYNWKARRDIYDTSTPANIAIAQQLPKLHYGWYRFRAYLIRGNVVKYCGSLLYFNPDLDTKPTYSISNVEGRVLDNSTVEFSFDCTLNPLNEVLYQGLQLYLEDGTKIADIGRVEGLGSNSQRITKSFNKSQLELDYNSYSFGLPIKAKYWYVPYDYNKTLYLELNSSFISDTSSPDISFTSVSITSNEVTETDEEGNPYGYKTTYQFEYSVSGSLWFDTIQYTINSEKWNNYWDAQSVSGDGQYSAHGWMEYGPSFTPHSSYYTILLNNGGQARSINSLTFSGSPGSITAGIGGTPAYQPALKTTHSERSLSSSSCYQERSIN